LGKLAKDYSRVELSADQSEAAIPKAHSTIETYRRYLNRHILPRWETIRASDMEPIEVQSWLRESSLAEGSIEQHFNQSSKHYAGWSSSTASGMASCPGAKNPIRLHSCVSKLEAQGWVLQQLLKEEVKLAAV